MSTAAQAFVDYRNFCLAHTPHRKQAAIDWGGLVDSASKSFNDNPAAWGAAGGAALGGISGLFSEAPGSVLRNALVGAGLGGLGGYGYGKFRDYKFDGGKQNKIESPLHPNASGAPGTEGALQQGPSDPGSPLRKAVNDNAAAETSATKGKGPALDNSYKPTIGEAAGFPTASVPVPRGTEQVGDMGGPPLVPGAKPQAGLPEFKDYKPTAETAQSFGPIERKTNKGLGDIKIGQRKKIEDQARQIATSLGFMEPKGVIGSLFEDPKEKELRKQLQAYFNPAPSPAAPSPEEIASADKLLQRVDKVKAIPGQISSGASKAVSDVGAMGDAGLQSIGNAWTNTTNAIANRGAAATTAKAEAAAAQAAAASQRQAQTQQLLDIMAKLNGR